MNLVNLLSLVLISLAAGILAVSLVFGLSPLITDMNKTVEDVAKLGIVEVSEQEKAMMESMPLAISLVGMAIFALPAVGFAAAGFGLWWWVGRTRQARLGTVDQRVWFGRLGGLLSLLIATLLVLYPLVLLVAAPVTEDFYDETLGIQIGPRDQWVSVLGVLSLAVFPGVFGVGLLWLSRRERRQVSDLPRRAGSTEVETAV